MEAARTLRAWTFRVENIPPETTAERLKDYFHTEDQPYIQVRSIVPAVDCEGPDGELTATISFQTRDETITAPRVLDDTISVDSDFHGFTPLSQPKGPIAADIIAVTGLAAHAYGSWAHSSRNMWLRDYLTKDVPNARVLIYGYPSQLQGSASSGILADHTNNFIHRLLSMRELARCQDRPIVFIGHSLGCLIIKKALSDVNGSIGRYSSCLPVCAMIFFGAPHRGLQTTALETLVKSQPTEEMLRELRARSPTLNDLNDKFRFVANDIDILTCFELLQTKTAVEMPDGSWKREGKPEMMVYQDSAQLNFPKEKMVSCHADHSQMAKLRRGESGAYPDIKRAIKQALLHVAEEQANVGLSRSQFRSGGKAVVEEHWRHKEDDINESRPERPPFPAEDYPLDDAQSQGSSIPEPQGQTVDVLHKRDAVSNPSPPVSDGRKHRVIFQDSEAISGSTITPPSTKTKSQDGGEIPKVDAEAPEATMQRTTDALSDRANAPSSLMEKISPDKAMDSVKEPTSRLELCSASREGDVEKVRSLLAQGCSIHESSEDLVELDRDAFLLAALNGRLDVLRVLLEHNGDVSKRNLTKRDTALHLISFDPEIKPKPVIESLVILLLDRGVPIEAKNTAGNTPLFYSACRGKISIAECLLDHGADIHSAENAGYTALHYAAQEGYLEMVALLISKGADIHVAGSNGFTTLHWAAHNGHHEVVALLISKGARVETRAKGDSLTPLHCSCFGENSSGESARLLLQAGADKEATTSCKFSHRPLHIAAQSGNLGVVNELLAFGVKIDAADSYDYGALHIAKERGHWRILEALLAKGANPLLVNKYGLRPSKHWDSDAKISQEDEEKCLELLKDAEQVWFEKRRQEKEKQRHEKEKRRQERKDRGDGRFSRFIARLND